MTTEQKRAIASLETISGWPLVLQNVVEAEKNAVLDRLLTTDDGDRQRTMAVELRTLHRMLARLTAYPKEVMRQLKEEGDDFYG